MRFWIDGDSCHRVAMDMVLNEHDFRRFNVIVVADRDVSGVTEKGARMMRVPHGSGETDNVIAERAEEGDVALTRDFSLGLRLLKKGVIVINDRGKIWNEKELKERIKEAELMKIIRNGGIIKEAGRYDSSGDSHAFARGLDTIFALHRHSQE